MVLEVVLQCTIHDIISPLDHKLLSHDRSAPRHNSNMGLSTNNWAIDNFFHWFSVASAALGLLGLLTALILFCINIGHEGTKKDKGSLCSDKNAMGYFVSGRKGGCCGLLPCCNGWPRAEVPEVPTLAGLFQAGDTLLYTSASLDGIPSNHDEICWVGLYSAILEEIAWQPPYMKAIERCASKLKKALSKARNSIKTRMSSAEESRVNDVEGDPMTFTPEGPERHTLY